jgi:SAM-dependent methyltransferase
LIVECESATQSAGGATETNRRFYDGLWSRTRLARPESFNTWPLLAELLPKRAARLEIGPGLRPRLPVAGTHFVDLSAPVVERLKANGGLAQIADLAALPFADASFDIVCAFDVIEHVEDDLRAFSEIARVVRTDGVVICAVPLHSRLWTPFDGFVGHVRRYNPDTLLEILDSKGLRLERSAPFGMQPGNPRLLDLAIWLLTHQRSGALFCYNWLIHPLSLRFQKRLTFHAGLLNTERAGEILLLCRRKSAPLASTPCSPCSDP